MSNRKLCQSLILALFGAGIVSALAANEQPRIDFNRQIRPILSENCFSCHGPDESKRKGDLRLDTAEGAYSDLGGYQAIKPNDAELSAVWQRITSTDPDDRMPPEKSGKQLTEDQIALLKRWIEQGARYQSHWAFAPPKRPAYPPVQNRNWPQNGIDHFILARLESESLEPEPEASRETLIRRVTLDLTGLPPAPEEVDAFIADSSPGAYERVVDRLLRSPRYGEHQARYWLDAARYGDTHGLHLDNERSMWPYRDWVIDAFNRNMPFDRFTIEQLAGDLLPEPTRDQLVATGFNRCNVTTSEGGAIDEEFYVRYAVDRVETTSAVWLGLTTACAACHDHKFDPISQKDFYRLFALFNNVAEKAMDGNALLPPPILKLPTPEQQAQMDELNAKISRIEGAIRDAIANVSYREPSAEPELAAEPFERVWVDDHFPVKIENNEQEKKSKDAAVWTGPHEGPVFSGTRALRRTSKELAQDLFTAASRPLVIGEGDKLFAYAYLDPADPPKAIMLQYYCTDWLHRANWGDEELIPYGQKGSDQKVSMGSLPPVGEWVRLEFDAAKLGIKPGAILNGMAFTQFGGTVYWDRAGLVTRTPQEDRSGISQLAWEKHERAKERSSLPNPVRDALKLEGEKRTDEQRKRINEYYIEQIYRETRPVFEPLHERLKTAKDQRNKLDKEIPATLVMKEMEKPRGAYVLIRGEYDKRGEPVSPGVPGFLPQLPSGETTNRLDFAKWLVDPNHPLTARVTVNRFWQQFFGTGLVKTANDFGSQGEWPSHPELLDWLATEFLASGWNVKALHRMIVTSAAYRQDSRVTKQKLEADPENRLISRGPRFRLDAEAIRDAALYLGGILDSKMGGRGVKPYQPPGIWEAVAYTSSNTAKYKQDSGGALFRRSIYTFWKRTAPPASMVALDAPSREACVVRRERTDTPLQALVLMNDPQFVEAARCLGERMILEGGSTPDSRLAFGFRLATSRRPTDFERRVLRRTLDDHLDRFQVDTAAAAKLIETGEAPVRELLDPAELAAYAMVANLLLNLDETLNKN